MTQENDAVTNPAQAFEQLRAEVSLLRRAVEGLAAERERMPDYSPTLGAIADHLKATLGALRRIEDSPAVRLTPDALTIEIIRSAEAARQEDARRLDDARAAMARAVGRIDGIVERGQAAGGQRRRLLWSCALSLLAGILLWSILPGVIVRSLT